MLELSFSKLSQETLKSILKIKENGIVPNKWNQMMVPCSGGLVEWATES